MVGKQDHVGEETIVGKRRWLRGNCGKEEILIKRRYEGEGRKRLQLPTQLRMPD